MWKVRCACKKSRVIADLSFCKDALTEKGFVGKCSSQRSRYAPCESAVPRVKPVLTGRGGSVMASIVKMFFSIVCTIASRLIIWSDGVAQNEITRSDPTWLCDMEFSLVSFWNLCFHSVSCRSRHSFTYTSSSLCLTVSLPVTFSYFIHRIHLSSLSDETVWGSSWGSGTVWDRQGLPNPRVCHNFCVKSSRGGLLLGTKSALMTLFSRPILRCACVCVWFIVRK